MEYIVGKYKHFDFLVLINSHYLHMVPGTNVRIDTQEEYILCNQILEDFFDNLVMANTIEEVIELALNLTGFFWYRQPFFDGNTRTLRKFLELLFKELKYHVDLTYKESDRPIIPIFYGDEESCNTNDINNLKRRLTKLE